MSIDIYQQCPCHEDKKIKFCCGKAIVQDLNDALSKHQSGQSQAALEQLERAMSTIGPKDCLTTFKTFIQISTQDVDGAEATNEAFLDRCPDHPTGLQQRCLIQVMRGEIDQASLTLQDAMDAIKGTELPVSLARAFESLGMALVARRNLLAARAHLSFALFLKEEDQRLQYMLHELYNPPGMVLFMKADHQLDPPAEGAEWEKSFANVHKAVARGQFRRALGMLLKLSEQHPEQPEITKGIAVVTSMFAPMEAQIAAWRTVAAMPEATPQDAIEYHGLAEAIASLSGKEPMVPVNRCTWECEDFESVKEVCISSDSMLAMNSVPEHDPFDEGPAPRGGFMVLDKPEVRSGEDLSIDNVPFAVGELLLYGKQTDRAARAEFICVENDQFQSSVKLLQDRLGFQQDAEVVAFDQVSEGGDAITWNWHLPEDTTPEKHQELLAVMKKRAMERWSNIGQEFVGGQSVREVADNPAFQSWVQAKLLHLQQTASGEVFDQDQIDSLREDLGVPKLEKLAPSEEEVLTPMQMCRVDAEKLSDDQLMGYFQLSLMTQNYIALRELTPEVLKRDHIEGARRDICHVNMARFANGPDEALDHFAKSRAEAAKIGAPIGILLVAEFEYRLRNGLEDKLETLLQTIESRHMEEPGVQQELARLFKSLGIHPGGIPEEVEMAPAEPAAVENSAGGSETASGLWIPD